MWPYHMSYNMLKRWHRLSNTKSKRDKFDLFYAGFHKASVASHMKWNPQVQFRFDTNSLPGSLLALFMVRVTSLSPVTNLYAGYSYKEFITKTPVWYSKLTYASFEGFERELKPGDYGFSDEMGGVESTAYASFIKYTNWARQRHTGLLSHFSYVTFVFDSPSQRLMVAVVPPHLPQSGIYVGITSNDRMHVTVRKLPNIKLLRLYLHEVYQYPLDDRIVNSGGRDTKLTVVSMSPVELYGLVILYTRFKDSDITTHPIQARGLINTSAVLSRFLLASICLCPVSSDGKIPSIDVSHMMHVGVDEFYEYGSTPWPQFSPFCYIDMHDILYDRRTKEMLKRSKPVKRVLTLDDAVEVASKMNVANEALVLDLKHHPLLLVAMGRRMDRRDCHNHHHHNHPTTTDAGNEASSASSSSSSSAETHASIGQYEPDTLHRMNHPLVSSIQLFSIHLDDRLPPSTANDPRHTTSFDGPVMMRVCHTREQLESQIESYWKQEECFPFQPVETCQSYYFTSPKHSHEGDGDDDE